MKHIIIKRLFSCGIGLWALAPIYAQSTLHPSLSPNCVQERDIAHLQSESIQQISEQLLAQFFACGARNNLTLFELFDDLIVRLDSKNMRIGIPGAMLRSLSTTYTYGRRRMSFFFPISFIDHVEIGAPLFNRPQLQIVLNDYPPDYTERVNWIGKITTRVDTYYGCNQVRQEKYEECFGLHAFNNVFSSTVSSIILYEKSKIAIYVKGFAVPKRWTLGTINARPPQ